MFKKRVAKSNSIRLKKEKTIDAIDEIDDVSSDSISFKIAEQKLRKSTPGVPPVLKPNTNTSTDKTGNMDTISSVSYGGGLVKATDLTTQSGMKDKQEEIMQKYIEENMKKLVGGEMSDINEKSEGQELLDEGTSSTSCSKDTGRILSEEQRYVGLNVALAEVELPCVYVDENVKATQDAKMRLNIPNKRNHNMMRSTGTDTAVNMSSGARSDGSEIRISSSAYVSAEGAEKISVPQSTVNALPPRFAVSSSMVNITGEAGDVSSYLLSSKSAIAPEERSIAKSVPLLPMPLPAIPSNMSEHEYSSSIYNGPSNSINRKLDRKRTNDEKSMDNFRKREKLYYK